MSRRVLNVRHLLTRLLTGLKNEFLEWALEGEQADPTGDQKRMVALQQEVAERGGFKRLGVEHVFAVTAAA